MRRLLKKPLNIKFNCTLRRQHKILKRRRLPKSRSVKDRRNSVDYWKKRENKRNRGKEKKKKLREED